MTGIVQFRPVAERALLAEFAQAIDPIAYAAVMQLDATLSAHPFAGFIEAVPAYVSLLVVFDPLVTDHVTVEVALRGLLTGPPSPVIKPAEREVLVCYDADLAPDLAAVAQATGMSPESVIAAHLTGDYAVFMFGFAPGYAYLTGVPQALHLSRKPKAIRGVPAGSVLMAGAHCIVSTLTMPTGWWIIGRSPTPILQDDPDRPFLFDVGDKVRFRRIDRATFDTFGVG